MEKVGKVSKGYWFALLILGCIGVQFFGGFTQSGYDMPNSGYYHGVVDARFNDDYDGGDAFSHFTFDFKGRTEWEWRWTYSTKYVYRRLQFRWDRWDKGGMDSGAQGTLDLPSLAFESSHGKGVLTKAVLSEWLLGTTNVPAAEARKVEMIFGLIEDAGHGTLHAPRHHLIGFEKPVHGSMTHFQLGMGVCGLVYVWIAVWMFLFLLACGFGIQWAESCLGCLAIMTRRRKAME